MKNLVNVENLKVKNDTSNWGAAHIMPTLSTREIEYLTKGYIVVEVILSLIYVWYKYISATHQHECL